MSKLLFKQDGSPHLRDKVLLDAPPETGEYRMEFAQGDHTPDWIRYTCRRVSASAGPCNAAERSVGEKLAANTAKKADEVEQPINNKRFM